MNKILLSFVVILFLLITCTTPFKKTPPSHKEKMRNSSRFDKNGWILIHVEGSPDVIGYQHGYLLASEIIDLRGAMAMMLLKQTKRDWNFYRDESFKLFWHKVPAEFRREIGGIAEGVNARLGKSSIDEKDLVAINSFFEVKDNYVPWYGNQKNPAPLEHCSAFIATGTWTKSGKIVVAHNNWDNYVTGQRWNVILDILPAKGYRMIMDAAPGFIHSGDDFNINSTGLIVTETSISGFNSFDTTGVAEFVRARRAIQYASSIDEWTAIMKDRNNGGFANDWLIGDNKTGEIARLELGLKNQILERTKNGYYVGANFPVNKKFITEETRYDTASQDVNPNIRKKRWEILMKENKGKIDVEMAKSFMADHYDMKRNKENPGRFTLCGHLDLDEYGRKGIGSGMEYQPFGAVQGKATDTYLANRMQFWAIMGHPCGQSFVAKSFLQAHPEYGYQEQYLRDIPGQQWFLTKIITRLENQ